MYVSMKYVHLCIVLYVCLHVCMYEVCAFMYCIVLYCIVLYVCMYVCMLIGSR